MKSMCAPLRVTRDVIQAYELRTGFVGIGEFFRNEGLFEIVEEEDHKPRPKDNESTTTSIQRAGAIKTLTSDRIKLSASIR